MVSVLGRLDAAKAFYAALGERLITIRGVCYAQWLDGSSWAAWTTFVLQWVMEGCALCTTGALFAASCSTPAIPLPSPQWRAPTASCSWSRRSRMGTSRCAAGSTCEQEVMPPARPPGAPAHTAALVLV